VVESNPTFACAITFTHHREGRSGLWLGLIYSLETSEKIFSAAEVIFPAFLVEYSAAEAPHI